ncbi:hypothetical protein MOBT1_002037 [Malassezia obtusa]|uniref:Uncharacterized protein n=1 Tax=Malassezia obtusa TaxID=76774 RepID=A0AAF0ITH4_9BASI|nr:hypothetical protein MOBT1_002037 [Malassezia obtusa]
MTVPSLYVGFSLRHMGREGRHRMTRPVAALMLQRGLAIPVNPSTSVDHMLGTAVPAAPEASPDHPNDPEDPDMFKYMLDSNTSNSDLAAHRARVERLRSHATGSSRRGTSIPGSEKLFAQSLEDAQVRWTDESKFLPPRQQPATRPAADPEEPHRVESSQENRSAIERYVISAARALVEQGGTLKSASLSELEEALVQKANEQLSIELPYEPMPKTERKVHLTTANSGEEEVIAAKNDGILLLCFVDEIGSGRERVSMCTGFAVQGGDALAKAENAGDGELVISCVHTLESATEKASERQSRGVALAVTRQGHIYPVRALLSSLPDADLSLLQLEKTPVQVDAVTSTLHTVEGGKLRTLPVSPYPAVVNTELSVSSFGGWLPAAPSAGQHGTFPALTENEVVRNRWARATLTGYKDPIGRVAETGTYDELAQLNFKLRDDVPETPEGLRGSNLMRSMTYFPLPGSSGGPVVDIETGSVVGIVRGHRTSQLHGSRGDAVPAEKIFEFFALPGLGKRR